MNFQDIVDYSEIIEKEIKNINEIINKLRNCMKLHQNWYNSLLNVLLNFNVSGTNAVSSANNLKNNVKKQYDNLKQNLIQIDFMNMWLILEKLNINNNDNKFNVIVKLNEFIKCMKDGYLKIHSFISSTNSTSQIYMDTIYVVNSMIYKYDEIIREINNLTLINESLNVSDEPSNLSIRLLNENNNLNDTVDSLKIIEDIYSIVGSIMKISSEEHPLKYNRIESGTMLAQLVGDGTAILIVGRVIKFSYTIYKEQFSWDARQRKALGDIKVRGEYLKLIREEAKIDKEPDNSKLQTQLQRLEELNNKLFQDNPSIILNGEKIGISELKNNKIADDFFLKENINKIQDNNSNNEK
ncbi:MAG: hypothetical protein LKE46_02015 [Clostridium sp.]|jgi:hypothetical protein|uniref:hypothetical protein n=1 Tax=Clostridium sp. TaxID=1506 RepID=UPI0025C440AB|nr:hypothetical protein [Clostridium sp.]MCH3963026.1 hypothetical protein [Clostridium sp.]MCI1871403.1 hypothetical protein [Clostridium sp.]MCI2202944.1 hypothetical protein [Clostridium sp.]